MSLKKIVSVLCAVSVFSMSAISVAASNYTPSVTKKDSVDVFMAFDDNGNEIDVIVTPASKSTNAPTEEAKRQMDAAFEEINNADSLSMLNIEGENPFKDDDKSDYVASHLFDVSFKDFDDSYFKNGATVDVTFTVDDLGDDVDAVWMHRSSTDNKWHVMDVEWISFNTYTITFDSFSPVAIFVPSDSANSFTSPQTGDTTNYMLYVVVALCVPVFIGVAIYARKKFAA